MPARPIEYEPPLETAVIEFRNPQEGPYSLQVSASSVFAPPTLIPFKIGHLEGRAVLAGSPNFDMNSIDGTRITFEFRLIFDDAPQLADVLRLAGYQVTAL